MGYMCQPLPGGGVEHKAFAARKDTGEMFTLEQLAGEYLCEPITLREDVPENICNVLEVIADTARAVSQTLPETGEQVAIMQGSELWGIGVKPARDGLGYVAYAQALGHKPIEIVRPISRDEQCLLPPDISCEKADVPEQAYNLMYVVASTASYMQLSQDINAVPRESGHRARLEKNRAPGDKGKGEFGR